MHQQLNIIKLSTHKLNRWFAWPAFPCFSLPSNLQEDLECSHPGSNWSKLWGARNWFNASTQLTSSAKHGRGSTWIDARELWRELQLCALVRPSPAVLPAQRRLLQHWPDLHWSSNFHLCQCHFLSLSFTLAPSNTHAQASSFQATVHPCLLHFVGFWFVSCNANAHPAQPCQRERPQKSVNKTWRVWTNWQVRKWVFAVLALVCSLAAKRTQPIEVCLIALPQSSPWSECLQHLARACFTCASVERAYLSEQQVSLSLGGRSPVYPAKRMVGKNGVYACFFWVRTYVVSVSGSRKIAKFCSKHRFCKFWPSRYRYNHCSLLLSFENWEWLNERKRRYWGLFHTMLLETLRLQDFGGWYQWYFWCLCASTASRASLLQTPSCDVPHPWLLQSNSLCEFGDTERACGHTRWL